MPCIQEYLEKEKGGEIRRLERDVTLDIAVNVSPCLSIFPISIITFCRVIPWAYELLNPMPYEVVVVYGILLLLQILEHR